MLAGMAMDLPTQVHARCVEQHARGQVAPLRFAGTSLGSSYDLTLPCGGVVAHPPGSGDLDAASKHLVECSQHGFCWQAKRVLWQPLLPVTTAGRHSMAPPPWQEKGEGDGVLWRRVCVLRSGLLRESPSRPADPGRPSHTSCEGFASRFATEGKWMQWLCGDSPSSPARLPPQADLWWQRRALSEKKSLCFGSDSEPTILATSVCPS